MRHTIWMILVAFTGCAMLPTDGLYVHEPSGYSLDRLATDKTVCYREAQGPKTAYRGEGVDPLVGAGVTAGILLGLTGSPRAGMALSGGSAALGAVGAMIAAERADAARYPPDVGKYRACLEQKGYWVE